MPGIQGPLQVRTYVDCCMRLVYQFWLEQRPIEGAPEPARQPPSMITFLNVMLGFFNARPAGQEIPPDGGIPTLKEQSVGQSTRNCHRPRTSREPFAEAAVHSRQSLSDTRDHCALVCQTLLFV
ncbi:hypothetical protein ACIA6D_37725 [Streptomyces cacaoi]|uniref:hypothetical protein n=1 Tax=Streptomyces cacaoi TaxID=1898 RepID=UPI0037483EED